jgi:haloalkane dehalogenase
MASTGEILRTPGERFESLPGFPFEPHYQEIRGLRIRYLTRSDLASLLERLPECEAFWPAAQRPRDT